MGLSLVAAAATQEDYKCYENRERHEDTNYDRLGTRRGGVHASTMLADF